MPHSKVKNLSSLFRSAIEKTPKSVLRSAAEDVTLKQFVSSIDSPFLSTSSSVTVDKPSKELRKASRNSASRLKKSSSRIVTESATENSTKQLTRDLSSILCGSTVLESLSSSPGPKFHNDGKSLEQVLDIPWFSNMSQACISQRRKEISRERKHKWVFKNTQNRRFDRLVRMCGQKLGTDATLEVFGKLGRETGVKEYNALIGLCMEKARKSEDEEVSIDQIHNAFQLFRSMREQGFQLEEETYGPVLMYLIDMEMIEEFQFFSGAIKDENPSSFSRLGYYEMMLWIRVNNEDKVQELCKSFGIDNGADMSTIPESYLLALCENDRKEEFLQLLEVVDITKISSLDHVASIFKSLGRLLLENFAVKYILAFKTSDDGVENVSHFIYNYAISMPNLAVEDVILKYQDLHEKLEVTPSSTSYEKLIAYCCDSFKVHAALDIVDQMCQAGFALPIETLHSILRACEDSCEFDLVHRIYSVTCRHNLKPNSETFRSMINLCVKMKDFEGAYGMLKDLEKMNLMPTTNMYNVIMGGFFREKNINGGLMVLKQMRCADLKPDSHTFSYLIGNSVCEEDIVKYYEEMQDAGVQVTKHIFMALINAYINCGQFEKAKQVILDKGIPVKNVNEIKSVLVSALASSGQMSEAIKIYEEIKQAGCNLEPKATISLIEHFQSEGELSRLLQLLEELTDPDNWFDGCCRIVLYCVRYKHLRSAVDLIKQLKDKVHNDELATNALFDQIFCQIAGTEPTELQIGLDLLRVIKEELDLCPSRKNLDFLLSACVNAKDLHTSWLIWEEYQKAGLPYNVLTFLRMYQALLASGEHKSAKKMLKKIPKDDPHVRCIIKACQTTYSNQSKEKK